MSLAVSAPQIFAICGSVGVIVREFLACRNSKNPNAETQLKIACAFSVPDAIGIGIATLWALSDSLFWCLFAATLLRVASVNSKPKIMVVAASAATLAQWGGVGLAFFELVKQAKTDPAFSLDASTAGTSCALLVIAAGILTWETAVYRRRPVHIAEELALLRNP